MPTEIVISLLENQRQSFRTASLLGGNKARQQASNDVIYMLRRCIECTEEDMVGRTVRFCVYSSAVVRTVKL